MGSQLHRALRSLCIDAGWKYAVFWKLKHRARMMLTWEDAYYDNDNPEKNCSSNFSNNLHDGHSSHDPMGLAVAQMSYHVYSLGQGVVGHVAVTGKHLWISADKHINDPGIPFEYCDGWQTQFSAGIKTIAVVAVVPYGVVQLGSLDQIAEDLKMVNHIRGIFFYLQDPLASSMESSCLSDVTTRSSGSGVYHEGIQNVDRGIDKSVVDFWSSMYSSIENPDHYSYNFSIPGSYRNQPFEMINKHNGAANSVRGCGIGDKFHVPTPRSDSVEQQKHKTSGGVGNIRCEGQNSGFKCLGECIANDNVSFSEKVCSKSIAYDAALPAANAALQMPHLPSEIHDSTTCNEEKETPGVTELPNILLSKNPTDLLHMPFRFSAGSELYEALGPAFRKQSTHYGWGAETNETDVAVEMSAKMLASSMLTANSGTEHLLEAVVANISNEINKTDESALKSEILLNSEKMSEPCTSDVGSISSAGYSFDRETLNSLNSSGTYGVRYSKGFSSTSCSRGSENLEKPQESNKTPKKRARPGESCRPRPRDRQLIQDRIKELRELVPTGSKCSIDSLLERTIKHMIFMQSITKHAEKLNKCTGSKLLDQEPRVRGASGTEQGSSWAVEVGSNSKVCPIIVENINMSGQMLVEMLCEECGYFIEIAEAIRSMGLTILKGVTESYGEKTWMRFVVEGQNNRSLHRMDVLWSLMQLLQPKVNV